MGTLVGTISGRSLKLVGIVASHIGWKPRCSENVWKRDIDHVFATTVVKMDMFCCLHARSNGCTLCTQKVHFEGDPKHECGISSEISGHGVWPQEPAKRQVRLDSSVCFHLLCYVVELGCRASRRAEDVEVVEESE